MNMFRITLIKDILKIINPNTEYLLLTRNVLFDYVWDTIPCDFPKDLSWRMSGWTPQDQWNLVCPARRENIWNLGFYCALKWWQTSDYGNYCMTLS